VPALRRNHEGRRHDPAAGPGPGPRRLRLFAMRIYNERALLPVAGVSCSLEHIPIGSIGMRPRFFDFAHVLEGRAGGIRERTAPAMSAARREPDSICSA
jgi:hypothetical protein